MKKLKSIHDDMMTFMLTSRMTFRMTLRGTFDSLELDTE